MLPSGALEGEPPDENRLLEASGNEGASFERSYHRAALVVWPRRRFIDVLLQAGVHATLPYLETRVALPSAGAARSEIMSEVRRVIDAWERRSGQRDVDDLVVDFDERLSRSGTSVTGDAENERLWRRAADRLLAASERPPPAPRDWRLDVKLSCNCADCRELQRFASDPAMQTHRFRVRKDRRQHLHRAIDSHGLDMTHVTERRGSPQTLICTKTRRNYARLCEEYRRDIDALGVLARIVDDSASDLAHYRARITAARARGSLSSPPTRSHREKDAANDVTHYCRICQATKPNEQFSGKNHRRHVCKDCARMPEADRRSMEQSDEIFGYLRQSHVSQKNIGRLRTLAASDDPHIAELAAIVLEVGTVKPYKRRRLRLLARERRDLLAALERTGLILAHHR